MVNLQKLSTIKLGRRPTRRRHVTFLKLSKSKNRQFQKNVEKVEKIWPNDKMNGQFTNLKTLKWGRRPVLTVRVRAHAPLLLWGSCTNRNAPAQTKRAGELKLSGEAQYIPEPCPETFQPTRNHPGKGLNPRGKPRNPSQGWRLWRGRPY